jgi:hypothetical protein
VKLPTLDLRENSARLTLTVLVVAALVGFVLALSAIYLMES